MTKHIAALLAAALVLSACGPTAPPPPPTPGLSLPARTGPMDIQHVFLVMMENHGYSSIWDSTTDPYIHSLGNQYARATNYHSLGHPTLPNYLQLFSGSNHNIRNDCSPSFLCHVNAPNLGDSLDAGNLSWKAYLESMPAPCYPRIKGNYDVRLNPLVYFDDIRNDRARCTAHDVPYSVLAADLATAATTPNFALVVPNMCSNMHYCSIAHGDTWLKENLPRILTSPACTSETCLLILTWDESEKYTGNTNQVLAIFAGSAAKTGGVTSDQLYTHYSLLRTIEEVLGLPALTANDASAAPMLDLLK